MTSPRSARAATRERLATLTKRAKRTAAQDALAFQLKAAKVQHEAEYHWDEPNTKRRADFYAWSVPDGWEVHRVLVEVDGGLYLQGEKQGGHTRGAARERDYERDAEAMMMGFRVLRVSPRQVKNGKAILWITELLK